MRGQRHNLAALYPRERPGTHCSGGWVGPRADLDRCGKSRPPPGFDPRTFQPVASPRQLFTPGKDPVPIVQEAGWAPGPVWTDAENLAPHRDSIPVQSSQSLYRLSYRGTQDLTSLLY